jgi:hypothetical protein
LLNVGKKCTKLVFWKSKGLETTAKELPSLSEVELFLRLGLFFAPS